MRQLRISTIAVCYTLLQVVAAPPVLLSGLASVLTTGSTQVACDVSDVLPKSSDGTDLHGIAILSDTQGVDFGPYLKEVAHITNESWKPLIPKEVNAPTYTKGGSMIQFTLLRNGGLMPHGMELKARSEDTNLDRASWKAIVSSRYPPLPAEFRGPNVVLCLTFFYNPGRPASQAPTK